MLFDLIAVTAIGYLVRDVVFRDDGPLLRFAHVGFVVICAGSLATGSPLMESAVDDRLISSAFRWVIAGWAIAGLAIHLYVFALKDRGRESSKEPEKI